LIAFNKEEINGLLKRIAKGSPESLEELYKLIGGCIFAVALDYVKRKEIAEELLQNTMIIIADKAGSIRFQNGKAWIMQIVKNLSIDYIRKHKNEITDIERLSDIPENKEIEDCFDSASLTDALKSLSGDEYDIIIRIYLQDLSVKETAKELNIKQDTVYKIHSRALNKLKKALGEGGFNNED
jgi:RNA polymerase sigma-70 factor (ECF subfamily)